MNDFQLLNTWDRCEVQFAEDTITSNIRIL